MEHAFSEISLILAIATIIALVMRLLKQPLIIGHIITGIIVGPTFLGLIDSAETLGVFAKFGIALLLFIIGLSLNPRVIKEVGKVAVFVGMTQIIVTAAAGIYIANLLGFNSADSIIMGIAISFSSTIIILKLISDKKEQSRLYAKIAIGILLVQDIVATLALLFLSASSSGSLQLTDFVELGILGTLIGGALWAISVYILPMFHSFISDSQEFLFLFAIGWGFGIATLFETIGFSLEVGALFAGVLLSNQVYTQEVSARLRPLRDFFIVVFFIVLGGELILDNFTEALISALIISLTILIINPLIIFLTMGLYGHTKRISFKVAVSMAQISEFSLVFAILALNQGRLSEEAMSVLTLVGIITIAISTYLIIYTDQIYAVLEDKLKLFERKKVAYDQESAQSYKVALFGYNKGGHDFIKLFKKMKKKFVVVDYDPDVIDLLESSSLNYLYGDATDIELLDEIGIEKAKLVVSCITDFETNLFLVTHIHALNNNAVIICNADTAKHARRLYEHGASYVIVAHSIGSEKVSNFIRKSGLSRQEFNKYKQKHLLELEEKIINQNELK